MKLFYLVYQIHSIYTVITPQVLPPLKNRFSIFCKMFKFNQFWNVKLIYPHGVNLKKYKIYFL